MSSLTRLKSLSTKSLSTKVGSKIKKLKQKVLKNAYINKYKRPFIFLLIILSGLTFTFLNLHFRTKEPETIYQVIEPEAPITNDLSFQNIKPNKNLYIKT